jgi:4-hydroxy-tetrahydrodipicolinate synthase
MLDFGNLMTAMVTPFDQNLEVDYKTMQTLSLKLIDNYTSGLVVCGTTGESPTLSNEEKINIIKCVKEVAGGKVPVIAGTGSYNTRESVSLSAEAEKAGADALLIVNPYYSKPDQNGLYEHFKAIASAVSIPLILYNHPGRTGVTIEADTLGKLSEISNIVAVKESSGSLDLFCQFKRATPPDFKIYSGDDPMNLPLYCLGGVGAISVASHVAGKELSEMFAALAAGNIEKAREIHYSLIDLFKILFCAPSPSPTKAALEILGFPVGGVRLPLTALSKENYAKVKTVLEKLFSTKY